MDFIVKFFLTVKRSLGTIFVEGNFRFAAKWRGAAPISENSGQTSKSQGGEASPKSDSSRGEERTMIAIRKSYSNQKSPTLESLPYPKRFVNFHAATLDMEGNVKLENSKSDPGGKTAWGISTSANPDLSQEIANGMTRERGFQIAFERYYSVIPNIALMDPRIAFVVYDSRFHGMKENLVVIESSLKKLGYNVIDDGKFEQETYRVLTTLRPTEVDIVMNDLKRALSLSASSAAKRTMAAQAKQGLEVHDYTQAFINRQTRRLSYAESFRSADVMV